MTSVKEYKCPGCGAVLDFNPASQKWKCHFCHTEYDKNQFGMDEKEELPDSDMPELDSYTCSSCGAELIADSTTSATFCLYCKSPAIIKNRFAGRFKPKSVIPFQLTKEQAKDIYKKWMNRRILAPGEFKQKEEIEKVTGIYAPFWLFDCKAEGFISGDAKQVSTWRSGDYKYTQTKYFYFARNGHASYSGIPVDASKKLDDKYMHMIEPFDYNAITDFSMKYMSGFMAEKYDVESSEAEAVMKRRVEGYLEERLRGTVNGYSSYDVNKRDFSISNIASSYSMLPIYLLINKYKDKEHVFIVNGQTGKVVGDTPISIPKLILFFLGVYIIALIIGFLGGALIV